MNLWEPEKGILSWAAQRISASQGGLKMAEEVVITPLLVSPAEYFMVVLQAAGMVSITQIS
jgi:hypothetical protein